MAYRYLYQRMTPERCTVIVDEHEVILTREQARNASIALAAVGGVTALASHLTKAGLRLAVNTSPEPFTNVAASSAGDVAVTGIATMAALAPVAAAVVAGILLLVGLIGLFVAMRQVKKGWNRFRSWRARRSTPAS